MYTFPHYFVQHAIHVCILRIYTTNRTRLCVSISYTVRVNHPTKPAADHWRRRWVSLGYWRLKYIIHHIYIHSLMLYYTYYTNEGKKLTSSRLIRGLNGTRLGIPCNKLYKLPVYNVYNIYIFIHEHYTQRDYRTVYAETL